MTKPKLNFKLNIGEKEYAVSPIINILSDGERSFVWIGNDDIDDMRCYATLEGKGLGELALKILYAIGRENYQYKDMKVSRRSS